MGVPFLNCFLRESSNFTRLRTPTNFSYMARRRPGRIYSGESMRDESHKTLIGIVREHVDVWRKQAGWSRESVVQTIVTAHDAMAGPEMTGIRFEPNTRDVFERNKVNADRVFRWLDDVGSDKNLLPANFLRSILSAMPMEVRMACVDDVLRPLGLGCRHTDEAPDIGINLSHVVEMITRDGDAHKAAAEAVANPTPENIAAAERKLSSSIEAKTRVRRILAGAYRAITGTRAVLAKLPGIRGRHKNRSVSSEAVGR
jgi:hypothetical protein